MMHHTTALFKKKKPHHCQKKLRTALTWMDYADPGRIPSRGLRLRSVNKNIPLGPTLAYAASGSVRCGSFSPSLPSFAPRPRRAGSGHGHRHGHGEARENRRSGRVGVSYLE